MRRQIVAISLIFLSSCNLTPKELAEADCRLDGFIEGSDFDQCIKSEMEAHDRSLRNEEEKQKQADAASCKEYGFTANTDAFAECLMTLEQARIQRKHDLKANGSKRDREVIYRNHNRSAPPKPIQCRNERMPAGLWTTNCY